MPSFDVPVLLLAWRRPGTTHQVIEAFRAVQPTRLFVACDGPNPDRPDEAEKVAATRALIQREIDWPCEIRHLYADHNQGCRHGVSRAISWFFSQVEEGIVMEDDCVAHPDFFTYCELLLAHYRHDTRVWCLSGVNFQDGSWRGDGSYYFSHYNHCWGWASWRRCWNHYDDGMTRWPALRSSDLLETIFEDPIERQYWCGIWDELEATGKPDSWAYRWMLTCFSEGGLTALPNRNLVSNVGFGVDGTNCNDLREPIPTAALGEEIRHPRFVLRDALADHHFVYHHLIPLLRPTGNPRRDAENAYVAGSATAGLHPELARSYLRQALQHHPWHLRSRLRLALLR